MNLTLALIAGLVLLLPGIKALTVWNFLGGRNGAKRPELQLTSVAALFIALIVSIAMHLIGEAVVSLVLAATVEIRPLMPPWWPTMAVAANPYDAVLSLAQGDGHMSPASLWAFVFLTFFECLLVFQLLASDGLDLVLEGADLRGQGWVFQHVVRPARHGYKPIAFVLTAPVQGEYGIGYEGVIADIRQGDDGTIKSISLAEPERFVYRLKPVNARQAGSQAALEISEREWVGGVVALEAAMIRNVVVHNISPEVLAEVEAMGVGEP